MPLLLYFYSNEGIFFIDKMQGGKRMANNRIDFQIGFSVDKTGLNKMQSLFEQISYKAQEPGQELNTGLQNAAKTASTLETILSKTFNTELGTLNVAKFNQELKKSNLTTQEIKTSLAGAGATGTTAYNLMTNAILGTNLQLKTTNKLLDEMAVSLSNTIKWNITSSFVNNISSSIRKAVRYVEDLDESLTNIRIVSQQSAAQMADFAQQANAAAQAMGSTTLKYTDSALIYYQQGLSNEEVIDRTNTTIKMANVLGESAEKVSDYMTAIWNNFDDGSKSLEYYGDVITALGAATASSSEEIATGLSKFAAVANTAGLSYEYATAALATVVAETRQSADTVGTAFKTIFARLQGLQLGETLDDGTTLNKYSKALEAVGVNIKDSNGKLKDMDTILDNLGSKWNSIERDQQLALAQTVAGTRQYSQLVALMENWEEIQKNINVAKKASGTLDEQQEIYMEGTEAHLNRLKAQFEELYSNVFKSDEINTIVDLFTNMTKSANNFIASFGGGVKSLLGLGSIVANIFNQQIINGIKQADQNIKKYNSNVDMLKEKQARLLENKASSDQNNSPQSAFDEAVLANTREQLEYAEKIQEARIGLNTEQYNTLTNYQKELGELEQEAVYAELLAKKQAKRNGLSAEYIQLMENDLSKYEDINAALGERQIILEENLAGAQEINKEVIKSVSNTKNLSSLDEKRAVILESLNSLETYANEDQQKKINALKKEAQGNKEVANIKERIKNITDEIVKTISKDIAQVEKEGQAADNLAKGFEKAAEAREKANNIKINFDQTISMADQGEKIAKIVTTITSSASTIAMAFGSISSVMDTLSDDTVSWGDKIVQITTTAVPAILMMNSAIKQVNAAMGIEGGLFKTIGTLIGAHKAMRMANAQAIDVETAAINAATLAKEKENATKEKDRLLENIKDRTYKKQTKELIENSQEKIKNALETSALSEEEIALNLAKEKGLKINEAQKKYLIAGVKEKKLDILATKAQADAEKIETEVTKTQTEAHKKFDDTLGKSKIGLIITAISVAVIAIKGIITLVDKLTMSAKEAEEQIASFNEKMKEFGNESSTYQNDVESLQAMSDEYDELSRKAGAYDANVANLTESERKRYNEIKNQLVEYNSGLLAFYNEQGEAILNNNDAIRETIELLKQEYEEKKKQLYNSEDFEKTLTAYETKYKNAVKKEISTDSTYQTYFNQVLDNADNAGIGDKVREILQGSPNEILSSEEELKKLFPEGKNYQNQLNDLLDYIKQYKNTSEKEIEQASKINVTSFVEGAKYLEDYNSGYLALQNAGVEGADSFLTSFVSNLKYNGNNKEIFNAINEFENNLAEAFSQGYVNQDSLDKAADKFSKQTFTTYADRVSKTSDAIKEFIENNPNFKEAAPEVQQAIFESLFGVSNVQEGKNGGFLFDINNYSDKITRFQKQLSEKFNGQEINRSELRNLIPDDQIDNLDAIIDSIDEAYIATGDWEGAIKAAIEELNRTDSFTQAQQNIALLNDVLTAAQKGDSLDEDQQQKLDALKEKYAEYFDGLTEGSHEYLQALRQIRELEEDEAKQNQQEKSENLIKKKELLEKEIKELEKTPVINDLEIPIKIKAKTDELEKTIQEIENSDYSIKMQIDADLATDVDNAFGLAAELDELKKLVTEDFQITADQAQEMIARGYGEMLIGAKETSTNMIQLDENVVNAYIDGQQSKMKADKETKIEELENQKIMLQNQLETLQAKRVALLKARAAQNEDTKRGFLAEAMTYEAQYKAQVQALNETLGAKDKANVEMTDNAKLAYDQLSQMYVTDSENAQTAMNDSTKKASEHGKKVTDYYNTMQQAVVNYSNAVQAEGTGDWTYTPVEWEDGGAPSGVSLTAQKAIKNEYIANNYKAISDQIDDLTKNLNKDELNKLLDQMIKDTDADIETLQEQIGAADAGIAALKTGWDSLDKAQKGNGSKKSGSSKDPDKMDLLDDEIDRYHDINLQIKNIERNLSNVEKQQERLTGKDLVDNLNQQLDILHKQTKAYATKIKMAQEEAKTLQSSLRKQGVSFNTDGTIANYEAILKAKENHVNSLINQYNNMSVEEQEGFKATVESAKKNYEKFKDDISNYDTLISETIPELREQIEDALNKEIEIQITKFNLEFDVTLNLTEATKKWNEFKRKVIQGFDDDSLIGTAQETFANMDLFYNIKGTGQIQVDTSQIQKVQAELAKLDAGQHSSVYSAYDKNSGIWVDNRAKAVEDLQKAYEQLMTDMSEYEDMIDAINEKFLSGIDQVKDAYDAQSETYEFFGKQIEHDMQMIKLINGDKAYSKLSSNYKSLIANDETQLKNYEAIAARWQKQMDEARIAGDTDAYEKYKENWLDAIDKLNSAIETFAQDITEQYANTINEIFAKIEQKLTDSKGFDYVDEELDLVNTKADMYLDTINSAYAIQNLKTKWMDAINDTSSENSQKRLNKLMNEQLTKLREKEKLTQYDVDRAEKEYEIAVKQLALEEAEQNKSQMRLKRDVNGNYSYQFVADQDEIAKAREELEKAKNDLYNFDKEHYLDNLKEVYEALKEFQDKVNEIYLSADLTPEQKQAQIEMVTKQYQEILDGLTNSNTDVLANLAQSAADAMKDLDISDTLENLIPQITSGAQAAIDKLKESGGFNNFFNDMFKELGNVFDDYNKKQQEIADNSNKVADSVKKENEALIKDANDAISKADEELEQLDKIKLAVDEIAKSWEEVKKKSIEAAEAANDYLKKDEQSKLPQNAGTSTSVQSSNSISTKTGPAASVQSWNGAAAKVSTVSFASGGYTGDWGDNNGRIAVLHKKELILNKDDTVNMLNIIDKVREYVNVINSLMTSKISNGTTPQNTSTIVNEPVQQDIHIDANFPNVYNAKEIEEALNNLTNIASQYVNRKDR